MSEPTIRYASVCSGVEAASLAWEKLDWKPVWFSEVEPFPCKVLAERFGASSPVNPLEPEDASDEKDRKERAKWLKAIRREKDTARHSASSAKNTNVQSTIAESLMLRVIRFPNICDRLAVKHEELSVRHRHDRRRSGSPADRPAD